MWRDASEKRHQLMNSYFWNGNAFVDYNFISKQQGRIFTVASFYPLWAWAASKEQAASTVAQLDRIEFEHGVAVCEKNDVPGSFQWNYPLGWAPIHYIVIRGLDNYGYKEEAARICSKYTSAVEALFEKTGTLWEKYDVNTGDNEVKIDYGSRVMIGWTAGVYLYAKEYLRSV